MLRFYFNDFDTHVSAPQSFVTFIITNLESSLFDLGDQIIAQDTYIQELIFLINGKCELNGYIEA